METPHAPEAAEIAPDAPYIFEVEIGSYGDMADIALRDRVLEGDTTALAELCDRQQERISASTQRLYQLDPDGLPQEDLYQERFALFIKSISAWNTDTGKNLRTQASIYEERYLRSLMERTSQRVTLGMHDGRRIAQLDKINKARAQDDLEPLSRHEIAEHFKVLLDPVLGSHARANALHILQGWQLTRGAVSFESTGRQELATRPDPQSATMLEEVEDYYVPGAVQSSLAKLSERQRDVVSAHYGLDGRPQQSMTEYARQQGLSTTRIREIHQSALKVLHRDAGMLALKEELLR